MEKRGPQVYDFRRPTALSRDHVRVFHIVAENFSRQAGSVLSAHLDTDCDLAVGTIEQLSFDEHFRSLEGPALLAVLDTTIGSVIGSGVLALSNSSMMAAVDHVLGGSGSGEQPVRGATDIELSLMRVLVERLLLELSRALEPVTAFGTRIAALESNPQFAQVMSPSDAVLVTTFQLVIGEVSGPLTLCLPLKPVAPALDAAVRRGRHAPDELTSPVTGAITAQLMHVPVDVRVTFAPFSLPAREILSLAPGDVVALAHNTSEPLTVTAAGVDYAVGMVGRSGTRQALRIIEPARVAAPAPNFEENP